MRRPTRALLALAAAASVLAGCGEDRGVDPAAHSDVTAADATVKLVAAAKADLVLYVSNQSLDDEEVRLTVTIDGATVVDDDFHVEGQHNWVSFPLALSPGAHEVIAGSDSGATLAEPLEVHRDKTLYAVIEHWTDPRPAYLTWYSRWRPLAFA